MYYTEDWARITARMNAWWRHEYDRPLVQVTAPKAGTDAGGDFDWWALMRPGADIEQVRDAFLRHCERTWYGGVAFPNMFFNMGPGALAAFCSGFLRFEPVSCSSWFERPQPWEVVEGYRFQENRWWRLLREAMDCFVEVCENRFILGVTDIGGILDVLASFRGAEALAMDLLTEPGRVHAARRRILEEWHHVYDRLLPVIFEKQQGMSAWMGLWCPGTWYPLQCDFAAMISPGQFEEFVLPDVIEQCTRLEYSIFHLDGPGQIPHLDMLLDVKELDGIQWVPGAGNPACEASQWRPLYEKILGRGKNLVLQCFDDVRKLPEALEGLPRKGVIISTGACSERDGRELLKLLESI